MDEPENELPGDDAREDATAAQVLYDATPYPGGGGLMQSGGAAERTRSPLGNAPNAPIALDVDAGDAGATEAAKARAAEDRGD